MSRRLTPATLHWHVEEPDRGEAASREIPIAAGCCILPCPVTEGRDTSQHSTCSAQHIKHAFPTTCVLIRSRCLQVPHVLLALVNLARLSLVGTHIGSEHRALLDDALRLDFLSINPDATPTSAPKDELGCTTDASGTSGPKVTELPQSRHRTPDRGGRGQESVSRHVAKHRGSQTDVWAYTGAAKESADRLREVGQQVRVS